MMRVREIARRFRLKLIARLLAVMVLAALLLIAYKGYRVYSRGRLLQSDLRAFESFARTPPDLAALSTLGALLTTTHNDAIALRDEASLLLPIAPHLRRVPGYGADLAAAGPLLDMVVDLTQAADESVSAIAPLLSPNGQHKPIGAALTSQLVASRPRLDAARQAIDRASAAQRQIPLDALSPAIRDRLTRLTTLLPAVRDTLTLAMIAPRLLGGEHPQSYLLMALNQDELRAGGGFITAAGVMTFDQGRRVEFSMRNSPDIDNRKAHLYPPPPEPMHRYMDIPQWIFADTNWSPDFPTSAAQAMYFYKLGQDRDTDGVIAFDQTALQQLLSVVGPMSVEAAPESISAENVIAYLRDARVAPDEQQTDWHTRKGTLISQIARPLLARIESDPTNLNLPALIQTLRRMLDERHIQIFLKDADAASLLAMYGWDGAVRPGPADFLMVVDSNVGYNKVNPNIRQAIAYNVDLREPRVPSATATITYTHRLSSPRACKSPAAYTDPYRYDALMTRCYIDFLRVLVPGDSQLEYTKTDRVPGSWLLSGVDDDGAVAVDQGDSTTWELSTLLVVPIGESRTIVFSYRLPPDVLTRNGDVWRYQLRLQKQAGTDAIPFTVRFRLPSGATVVGGLPFVQSNRLSIPGQLTQDQTIQMAFRTP